MLYNFPELTGKRIDLPTIAAFADRAPMIGIKQSGGEFAYHQDLIALGREKGFAVMSGSDTRLPEVFQAGRRRLHRWARQHRAGADGAHLPGVRRRPGRVMHALAAERMKRSWAG